MDASAFLEELKRRTCSRARIDDPLAAAQSFIDKNGTTGEGRAMCRVLEAMWCGKGEFRESDVASFSSTSLELIAALLDARREDKYPDWRWIRASCHPPWKFLLHLHQSLDAASDRQIAPGVPNEPS